MERQPAPNRKLHLHKVNDVVAALLEFLHQLVPVDHIKVQELLEKQRLHVLVPAAHSLYRLPNCKIMGHQAGGGACGPCPVRTPPMYLLVMPVCLHERVEFLRHVSMARASATQEPKTFNADLESEVHRTLCPPLARSESARQKGHVQYLVILSLCRCSVRSARLLLLRECGLPIEGSEALPEWEHVT